MQGSRLHFLIELSQEMSKDVLANDSDISLLSYLHSERQFSRAWRIRCESDTAAARLMYFCFFLLSLCWEKFRKELKQYN